MPNSVKSRHTAVKIYGAMAAVVVVLSMMVVWYVTARVMEHRQMFRQEVANFERAMQVQRSTLGLRVKDTVGFIAAGMGAEVARKLRETNLRSPYLLALGRFPLSDPNEIAAYIGDPLVFSRLDTYEYRSVLQKYQKNPGIVYTWTKNEFTALFPDLPVHAVVMAQSMPVSSGREERVLVYAVIDIEGLVRDSASRLRNGALRSVRFETPGFWYRSSYPVEPHWMDHFYAPATATFPVRFGRDSHFTVTLKERTEPLASLFVMISGLTLLGVVSLVLMIAYQRMHRLAERRLHLAVIEANKGNRTKSLFLANMSHEIRTPLNGVLGMAQLLARTELTDGQRRYVEQIKASGTTLLAILNDILDISKLEAGQLAIDPVPTNLRAVVVDTTAFFAPSAHQKGLDIFLDIDPQLPVQVEVDPVRLRQVLSNFISNALKFTERGMIIVSAQMETCDSQTRSAIVNFAIEDTGLGIDDQNIVKLFSRFTQAESNTTRIFGGTGLGLSICREICELMGGSVGVQSEKGKGSTFSFSLPLRCTRMAKRRNSPPLHIALFTGCRRLAAIVERAFEAEGLSLAWYGSGIHDAQGAIAAHVKNPFDVAVFDEGRHIGQARTLRNALREHPSTATVPCVILGRQEVNEAYKLFDSVVRIPFDGSRLVARILGLLKLAPDAVGEGTASDGGSLIPQTPRYGGRNALLVDDNNVNILFGVEILKQLGFSVATANNGVKAVEAVTAARFDVIFMDCQMPVMDGYDASRRIRTMIEAGDLARVPIVAVTANALKGDKQRCLDAGMDYFITKPMKIEALEGVLGDLFPHRVETVEEAPASPEPSSPIAGTSTREVFAVPPTQKEQQMFGRKPRSAPVPVPVQAPEHDAPHEPLIDMTVFEGTRESMSNFDTLITLYREDAAAHLETIQNLLAMEAYGDIVLPAHTIKGSSRIIGAEALARLAEALEEHAGGETPNVSLLVATHKKMKTVFADTSRQISVAMQRGDCVM